jgi:hypothetical protein
VFLSNHSGGKTQDLQVTSVRPECSSGGGRAKEVCVGSWHWDTCFLAQGSTLEVQRRNQAVVRQQKLEPGPAAQRLASYLPQPASCCLGKNSGSSSWQEAAYQLPSHSFKGLVARRTGLCPGPRDMFLERLCR